MCANSFRVCKVDNLHFCLVVFFVVVFFPLQTLLFFSAMSLSVNLLHSNLETSKWKHLKWNCNPIYFAFLLGWMGFTSLVSLPPSPTTLVNSHDESWKKNVHRLKLDQTLLHRVIAPPFLTVEPVKTFLSKVVGRHWPPAIKGLYKTTAWEVHWQLHHCGVWCSCLCF